MSLLKSFKTFLDESLEDLYFDDDLNEATKDNPNIEGEVSNNTKGVLHEILTGKHLNGGTHMKKHVNELGETPEQAHDRLKAQIHPKDYEKLDAAAKAAADHIKEHINSTHPGHEIHSVIHTSKPGDTKKVTGVNASQKEDSSDIYVTTKHPETGELTHHGVSMKVSSNASSKIPSSSLGAAFSGEHATALHKDHKEKIKAMFPELATASNKEARKAIQKANPIMGHAIKEHNKALLHSIAHSHAAELQHNLDNGNHAHTISHIRTLLHAHQTPAQKAGHNFFKHTTFKTKAGTQHKVSDPGSDFEDILKDHKNITVKSGGGSVNFFHKGKKFASQAHKFDSQSDPLSPIKSAGTEV